MALQILHHLIRVKFQVFFSTSAVASARQIG
jgi:hypothetical protein